MFFDSALKCLPQVRWFIYSHTFLMNLVNFRYNKIKDDGEIITKSLGNKEICKIYKDKNKKWEKEKNKNPADMENQRVKVFFLTKTQKPKK